eukprot:PhF_6_TR2317/c0_g1_i1/m.4099/K14555/UTP13, TBL3; U3 small nucleolar RNA-associated protein 13
MLKSEYKQASSIRVLHSGGKVCANESATVLATIFGESVNVVDSTTGSIHHTFNINSPVTAVAVSSVDTICIASADLQLALYKLDTVSPNYTLIKQWAGAQNTSISTLAFNRKGNSLCSACADGSAKIWDVELNHVTHSIQNSEGVTTVVTFIDSPDGSPALIAFGNFDGKVALWDLATKKKIQTISEHVRGIDSITVLENEDSLTSVVIAGLDRRIVCLRRKSVKSLFVVFHSFVVKENITAALVYVGGGLPLMATTTEEGHVGLYNLGSLPEVRTIKHIEPTDLLGEGFTSITHCSSTNELLLVSTNHNLLILNGSTGAVSRCLIGFLDQVLSLQYVAEHKTLVAANNSNTLHVFSPGECISRNQLIGHTDIVMVVAISPDGKFLATGSKDTNIRIWDTQSMQCTAICVGHTAEVGTVAFTNVAKSSVFALASGSADESVKIFILTSLRKDEPVARSNSGKTKGKQGKPAPVAVRPSSSGDTKIQRFEAAHTVAGAHGGGLFTVAFSMNDAQLATGGKDKLARIYSWNTKNGIIGLGDLKGHRRAVYCVVFSPTESQLATTSGDKTIRLWNTNDYTCIRTLQGHETTVLAVHYMSGGQQLVSCSGDGMIKVWTAHSGACLSTLDGHEDKVWCLSLAEDGERIFSGGADAVITEWQNITAETKEEGRQQRAKRILEQQELENCVRENRFEDGFLLGLRLGYPRNLHNVVAQWSLKEGSMQEISLCVSTLSEDDIKKLVTYCRDWLLVARRARVAHVCINAVLRSKSPLDLMKLPWMKELVEGCQSYTSKYYNRVTTQLQELHYLDFLVNIGTIGNVDVSAMKRPRTDET